MADRHQFRANWHDYNDGIYFVTICCADRKHYLGEIQDGDMILSDAGNIVDACIKEIPQHLPDIRVLNHVVMPNHIHMVISVGAQYIAPATNNGPNSSTGIAPATNKKQNMGCLRHKEHGESCSDFHYHSRLAIVVRTFKAACTRLIRAQSTMAASTRAQCIAPLQIWQRNYYEHIIRNQRAFDNIMNYIDCNVEVWDRDCFNSK